MAKLTDWAKYQIGLKEIKRILNNTSSHASNADLAGRVTGLALELGAITLNAYRAYHGDTGHAQKIPLEIANIELYKYLWHVMWQYVDRRFPTSRLEDTANST